MVAMGALSGKCALCALAVSIAVNAAAAPSAPRWYDKRPEDTGDLLYQVGYAEKCETRDEAEQKAFANALSRHASRISVYVWSVISDRVEEDNEGLRNSTRMRVDAAARHQLIGTDIVEEEVKEQRGKWYAWALVSYPRAQYQKALERVEEGSEDEAGDDGRTPLLVCPVAFGEDSSEQFPAIVAAYKQKGYGNGIWQSIEDKLYETGKYRIVAPPSKQVKSMLEQILAAKAPDAGQEQLPSKILLCNMNFFEVKSEKLRFGALERNTSYHVELMLEYYNVTGPWTNVKIPSRGEAKHVDLLEATNQAADMAVEKLLERIAMER